MPELPEVEIVRQSLDKKIKGQIVKKVIVKNRNLRFEVPKNLEINFKNQKIVKVDRFSKYLILFLSNNLICLIHLGMSGTIHLIKNKNERLITNTSFYHSITLPKKHNHIEIFFDDFKVIYNDPRRFGFFKIIENNEKLKHFFKNYGPEPFDKKFNLEYLKKSLKNKTKNIKNYLLDQKFVAGIGNIYANEILYFCKINPFEQSKNLNKRDYKNIIFYSKKVLKNAIKKGGSSIQNFTNTQGNKGSFQDNFKVYQRDKLNCLRKDCNGKIEKKKLNEYRRLRKLRKQK